MFGTQQRILHTVGFCDAGDWDGVAGSNLFWSFSTAGVVGTREGVDEARVVVLKASPGPPAGAGGMEISVGEMGGREREDWEVAWTRFWSRHPDASDDELDRMDPSAARNLALNEVLSGRFESFEGDGGKAPLVEGSVRSLDLWDAPRIHCLRLLCCCWD